MSAFLPGLAHLCSGRRRAGLLLMGTVLAAAGGITAAVMWRGTDLVKLVVQPRWLVAIVAASAGLAVIWAGIVIRSYLVSRPADLSLPKRITGGLGVSLLSLVVAAPFVLAARYAYVQHDLVTSLFGDHRSSPFLGRSEGPDPWRGMDRVNILLLGSDAAEERYGVRTDSIHLASIDTRTGRTVLFSLPRNLEDVPLPPGPLRQRFPQGFDGLLFGVYQYAAEHPRVAPRAPNPGAELVKRTVGQVLGLPVHYYAIVDLDGFQKLVDAMGGVHLCVQRPIPYGHRGKFVRPGCRKLSGSEALWYGRSRTLSDDYDRMKRQRCLIGAMVRQADPVTVLRHYQGLAGAVKQIVETDVPQHLLPDLLDLGMKVKDARITSLQFVPPLISPAYPDFPRIRHLAHQAIERSERQPSPAPQESDAKPKLAGGAMPPPGPGGTVAGQPGQAGPPTGQAPGQQGPGQQRPGQRPGQQGPGPGPGPGNATAVSLQAACP